MEDKKFKEEVCKVLWIKDGKVAFDFKGYGIVEIIPNSIAIKDAVKVKYKGEIGKDDFTYQIVKGK